MRLPLRLALSLMPLWGWLPAQVPPTPPAAEDPLLRSLIQEALAQNPDLAKASALVAAERERIPQAKALPDPTLSVGLQNDGFKKLQIGEMETSYYQVMVTQPLPWPGKRALRGDVARLGAEAAEFSTTRTRLTLEAEVRRAYTGLLLARSQQRLLEEQAGLLKQAEAIARTRYGVGQGSQADLFRAQLEATRLLQTRYSLTAEERTLLAGLNRLRAMPLDTPIATGRTLETQADPAPMVPAEMVARAQASSPELKAARVNVQQAERSLDLAKLDRRPDFAVSAGVMPRGSFEPMWTASVAITLPLWQKNKQHRAVAESEQRRRAQGSEAESVRNLLALRIQERANQLEALLSSLRLYREGLLVQSEGSFRATLAQYEVGRVPFLSVLEALNGWIADRSALLQTQAQAQAIHIATDELNLGPTPPIGSGALGAAAMGTSGGSAPASGPSSKAAPKGGADSGSSSMKSM